MIAEYLTHWMPRSWRAAIGRLNDVEAVIIILLILVALGFGISFLASHSDMTPSSVQYRNESDDDDSNNNNGGGGDGGGNTSGGGAPTGGQ